MLKSYEGYDYLSIRNNEFCTIGNFDIKELEILIKGKGNKERFVSISPYLKKSMLKYERVKEQYFKYKDINYDNYFLSRTGRSCRKNCKNSRKYSRS